MRRLSAFIGVLHDNWSKERANFLMLARRAKGQKPRPALSFQNAEQGFLETKIENYMGQAKAIVIGLRFCGSGGGRRRRGGWRSASAAVLRGRQVARDLISAHVENDDLIRRHARAAFYVELHGLARSFVLFFDGLVVGHDGKRVFCFFRVRFVQRHLYRANALGALRFLYRELVVVAVAATPQIIQVVVVARDQPAHHVHVAQAAFQLAFRRFQVRFRRFDVFLRAAHFGGHGADLFFILFLRLAQLRRQLLIGGLLFLADGFGAALSLRELRLRQAHSLRGDLHLAFQIGDARIRLVELRGQHFILFLLLPQVLAQPGLRGIAGKAQHGHPGNQYAKQHDDPPRRTRGFVAIRLLRARNVWRNAHSPSSVIGAPIHICAERELSPAFAPLSTARCRSRILTTPTYASPLPRFYPSRAQPHPVIPNAAGRRFFFPLRSCALFSIPHTIAG